MYWRFSRIYSRVLARLHSSSANTVLLAEVKEWVNQSNQDLHSRPNKVAPWALKRVTLLTTAPTTSSSVSLTFTVDDATVTADSAIFTSAMVGRKIKLGSFDEVYTIRTFTSTTSIELDQIFNGTTTTSTGWRIWEDTISLPPFTHIIMSLQVRGKKGELRELSPQEFIDEYGDNNSPGTPVAYTVDTSTSIEGAVSALTGTWTFTDESTAITADSDGAALTELKVGDLIRKNSSDTLWREVESITDDDTVTLRQAWNGTTGAASASATQKATGWQKVILGPHPNDEYSLIAYVQKIPVELAADANIPEMPENVARILIEGALVFGSEYREDARSAARVDFYEEEVAKVLVNVKKTHPRAAIFPDVDSYSRAFPGR